MYKTRHLFFDGISDERIVAILCDRCRAVQGKDVSICRSNVKDQSQASAIRVTPRKIVMRDRNTCGTKKTTCTAVYGCSTGVRVYEQ